MNATFGNNWYHGGLFSSTLFKLFSYLFQSVKTLFDSNKDRTALLG